MSDLTDVEVQALAKEMNEAVPAFRTFFSLSRDDQIRVVSKIADGMIGTDETAQLKELPFMTPEMLESVSDMFIPFVTSLFLKWLAPDENGLEAGPG